MVEAMQLLEMTKHDIICECTRLEDDEYNNPIKKEIRTTHQTQFNQIYKSSKTKHSNIRVNIPRR